MRPVGTFQVTPILPERLRPLAEIAQNVRWSWNHDAIELFRRLSADLWEESGHNPVLLLATIPQDRLREASSDDRFLAHMDLVAQGLSQYVSGQSSWYRRSVGATGETARQLVGYFSMEFGITECLPLYTGGLGILAGDHLKSASDLGLPMVGVGLLYRKGSFHQALDEEGWQREQYRPIDVPTLPVQACRDERGEPIRIRLDLAGRQTLVQLWRAKIGRVPLILLDTQIPENPKEVQEVTDEPYGGELERRIQQEIVLGIGGVRALEALGLGPSVFHMNEGHCAFLALERIRRLMGEASLSFGEAREVVSASTVFTTHTPVPAGTDVFAPAMIERHFGDYRLELGLSAEGLLDLGRRRPGAADELFNMTVLAIRSSGFINGVSRLHARVSRGMWRDLWPELPEDEIPILPITNGIHPASWISADMRALYDRRLGPGWSEESADGEPWTLAHRIPEEEIWRTHEQRREKLVAFARRHLRQQLLRRRAGPVELAQAEAALDPRALTIGFARRSAAYKRSELVFRDPERLARILSAPGRPVQILFAGKSHPRDEEGKRLVRTIVQIARRPEMRGRIVFLENYSAAIARYLVQGVDVWLNTPRRPMEASGTSGMKAVFNGVLNLSVLDGWWDEAYMPDVGWAIGSGGESADQAGQDQADAASLYERLEREIVPLFYERGADGLPRGWIRLMTGSLAGLAPVYSAHRMVRQYATEAYLPARDRRGALEADGYGRARSLAAFTARARVAWPGIRIVKVESDFPAEAHPGESYEVRASVDPGQLAPDELMAQVVVGRVGEGGDLRAGAAVPMTCEAPATGPTILFRAQVPCEASGRNGFSVRLLPRHPDLLHPSAMGLIRWAP